MLRVEEYRIKNDGIVVIWKILCIGRSSFGHASGHNHHETNNNSSTKGSSMWDQSIFFILRYSMMIHLPTIPHIMLAIQNL
jgi:hypothetical protein